jgi:hypothetical protein
MSQKKVYAGDDWTTFVQAHLRGCLRSKGCENGNPAVLATAPTRRLLRRQLAGEDVSGAVGWSCRCTLEGHAVAAASRAPASDSAVSGRDPERGTVVSMVIVGVLCRRRGGGSASLPGEVPGDRFAAMMISAWASLTGVLLFTAFVHGRLHTMAARCKTQTVATKQVAKDVK